MNYKDLKFNAVVIVTCILLITGLFIYQFNVTDEENSNIIIDDLSHQNREISSSKAGLDNSPPVSSPETSLYSQPQPIRVLQKTLMDLGYDCGDNAPDGVLGNKTLTSYREWDKLNAGFVLDYYKEQE